MWGITCYTLPLAFGMRESTLLLAFRLLGVWCLAIWMPRNVNIPMFGLTLNSQECEIIMYGLFLRILDELFIFSMLSLDL